MTEAEAVSSAVRPATRSSMTAELLALGVQPGACLLVHASLSSLGWVCGGPVAVIEALLDTLGAAGTLMMPAHTTWNTDPARWQNPPVPEEWWPEIRRSLPPYDPEKSPTAYMGAIAEAFRKWPGVMRSAHPIGSFCAHGPLASELTKEHPLEPMFGDESPVGRLYKHQGQVLLIGVGHDSNTSLHLAEYRAQFRAEFLTEGCARTLDGQRVWQEFRMQALDTDDFCAIGKEFEDATHPTRGALGAGSALLLDQRSLVEFATEWMTLNRAK